MKFGDLRIAALILALTIGALLAWGASHTPKPLPPDAPAAAFSAGRAMIDDRAMASRPHPIGSAEAGLVRSYLFQRMQVLGLQPRTATGEAIEVPRWAKTFAVGARVENLVGVLKGADPSLPAVAIMAHSDSVPGSPGAADDAAGVSTALEVARALKATGTHARDVVVLITDGEEAGLLGARAFFSSDDPLLPHIGEIVNLEARGGGGRVAMFQTGERNGAQIGLFGRAVGDSDANSLTSEVYKHMPNDTDFTVSRAKGLPGFNFAFIGEEFDYHSPSSTPDALDQGALQHMGDQALSTVRALADAQVLPKASPDAAYSDVLGRGLVAYPAVLGGWILLVLALGGAIFATIRGQRLDGDRGIRPGALAWGAVGSLVLTILIAVVLWAAGQLAGLGDFTRHRALLADYPAFFGGFALLTVGVGLLLAGPIRGRWGFLVALKETRWSSWLGTVLILAVFTMALLIAFPPMAMLSEWPLAAAAVVMLAAAFAGGRLEDAAPTAAAGLIGLIVVAHLGHFADETFTAVGEMAPEALAAFVLIAIPALFPLLAGWAAGGRRVQIAALAVAVAGVAVLVVAETRPPWTARTPQAVQAFYVQDWTSGHSWRASALDHLDPWSKAALDGGGAKPERRDIPALGGKFWLEPAASAGEQRPVFTSSRDGDAVLVHIAPQAGGRELRLTLSTTAALHTVTLDGEPVALLGQPGTLNHVRWSAPGDGLTLRFIPSGPGELDLKYAEVKDGWPEGMLAPPKPADAMPWGLSDTTVVLAELKTKW